MLRFIALIMSVVCGFFAWSHAKNIGADFLNGRMVTDSLTLTLAALALVSFAVAINAFGSKSKSSGKSKAKANA
jgi:hypothetical protein